MADYNPKTNWLPDDPITEDDLNRIEKGIKDANDDINNHKLQTNNPHGVTKAQVGLGSVDNVRQASKQEFDAHKNDKANPHGVTKSQVGLGNVDNLKQATKEEFDAHKNNTNNPHDVTSEQVNLKTIGWAADTPYDQLPKGMTVTQIPTSSGYPLSNGTLITNNVSQFRCNQILLSHSQQASTRMLFRIYHQDAGWSEWKEVSATDGDYTNLRARATTKADVGLGNVENYGIATQAEAEAGTSNTKYMTPQRTKQAVDKGTAPLNQNITTVGTTLLNHIDNKNNPHGVTSHQVNRIATGWPANTPYDELPTGITVTQVPSNSGYPISIGTLITNNVTQHRCTQLFFHPSTLTRMWFRIYHGEHGWTSWAEIETTAGAQTKADQAETNAKNASLSRTGGTVTGTVNVEAGTPSPLRIKRTDSNANIAIEYQMGNLVRFLGFDEGGNLKVGSSQNLTGTGQGVALTNGDYLSLRARATTKTDVGLGNVENYGIATQAEAEAGTSNTKYMTPLRDRQAFNQYIGATTIGSLWTSSIARQIGSRGSDGAVHYILLCRTGIFSKTTGIISGSRASSGNNANGLFLVEASHSTSSSSSAQVIALQSQASGISLVTLTHSNQNYIALRFNRTQFQEYNAFFFRGDSTHLSQIKLVEEDEVSNVSTYDGGNARDVTILGSNGLSINGKVSENIVQQGSNANGEFIRYDSGLQICWGTPFSVETDVLINANDPNLWRSESNSWTYPAMFDDNYPITVVAAHNGLNRLAGPVGPTGGGNVSIRGYYLGRNPSGTITIRTIAIGRWK
ncbi:hypothetical protein [Halalkalibacterium halodurans]|uniref:Uncharacterized protein n=1 Tax=Halalkalibacterium halodurans TaxID=86665 RepID=A0A0M0KLZ1_ALKHA|nr:hypothetical protein [Halalkalibacterium halodurans]TPE70679.1 hypothetical protein AMD02_001550 [Halalkalibacterium halodurans]